MQYFQDISYTFDPLKTESKFESNEDYPAEELPTEQNIDQVKTKKLSKNCLCPLCDKKFNHKTNLAQHIQRFHEKNCHLCYDLFETLLKEY